MGANDVGHLVSVNSPLKPIVELLGLGLDESRMVYCCYQRFRVLCLFRRYCVFPFEESIPKR